jgi:hypothetical protein
MPIYKEWWAWLIVAVALALVIGGIVLGTSGSTTKSATSTTETTSGSTAGTGAETTTPPTTAAAPAATPSVPPSFGGTAHPTLTAGTPGTLDVTYVGTAYSQGSGTIVPVEVWNGTSQSVKGIDIAGSAMSGPTVVGSGSSQDVQPALLDPGQVAFGMVYFSQSFPSGTTFNLKATGSSYSSRTNAQVVQANYTASGGYGSGSVVGTVTNNGSATMTWPIGTDLYCFSTGGALLIVMSGYVDGNAGLASGATGSYSIAISTDNALNALPCPTFLVGSSG